MILTHTTRAFILATVSIAAAGCAEDDPATDPPEVDAAVDGAIDPDGAAPVDMAVEVDMESALDMAPDAEVPDAAPPPGRMAQFEACLDRVLDETTATAVTAAVVEGGEVIHLAAVGHRNDPEQTPVEPTTLFRFGSTLKGMTSLAMLAQVDAERATVDDLVVDIVPELAANPDPRWGALTVHHLLSHQGGMADFLALEEPGEPDSRLSDYLTSPDFARGAYFMVDPGTFYNYSNPNFMLAGLAIERLTGETYREAMQATVFEPLGMERVMFTAESVLADGDFAHGVTAGDLPGTLRAVPPDAYECVWSRPAGFGWASVVDLARYTQYVIDGTADAAPVSEASWEAWRTPHADTEPVGVAGHYGYGLLIFDGLRLGDTYRPAPVIGHDGNIPGFTSALITVPSLGLGVTALANGDGLNGQLANCAAVLVATAENLPDPVERPVLAPEPARFVDYVGRYDGTPNVGPIIITGDESGLLIELPLVDEAGIPYDTRLVPVGPDVFILSIQGMQLAVTGFRAEGDEAIRYLRNRIFVGTRSAGVEKRGRIEPDALRRWLSRRLLAEPINAPNW